MPSTVSGELRVVIANDLGGLGDFSGPSLLYSWPAASLAPGFLPWLALLGLLGLKRNRSWQAWWIWVPLGLEFGMARAALSLFEDVDPDFMVGTVSMATALACGLAAIWLLASYLNRGNNLGALLRILIVLTGFSVVVFALPRDWEAAPPSDFMRIPVTAMFAVELGIALFLAGRSCRHRYAPTRLLIAVTAWLAVLWLPVVICIAWFDPQIFPDFMLGLWTAMIGVCFLLLLPFLILASVNPFFQEQLMSILRNQITAPATRDRYASCRCSDSDR